MPRSLFLLLLMLATCFASVSPALADMSTPDEFDKWDKELNQSWGALDQVNQDIEKKMPEVSTVSVQKPKSVKAQRVVIAKPLAYEEESIDSRQVSDMKARIDRLEGRVKQLERNEGALTDQIRNLDRTVNDLRRKI